MPKLRLLLGDDHTLFRHGLRKILEERPDWEVVAEVGDGRDAVAKCLELKPDVAILDVAMPLLNGIDATKQITRKAGRHAGAGGQHAFRRSLRDQSTAGGRNRLHAQRQRGQRSHHGC